MDRTDQVPTSTNAVPRLAPVLNAATRETDEALRQASQFLERTKPVSHIAFQRPADRSAVEAPGVGRIASAVVAFARVSALLPEPAVTPISLTVGDRSISFVLPVEAADAFALWVNRATVSVEALTETLRAAHRDVRPAFTVVTGGAGR